MHSVLTLWNHTAPYTDQSPDQAQPSVREFAVPGAETAVVVCPGGGYVCKAPHEGDPIAEMLNAGGIAAYVLDYRVKPCHYLAPLGDAQRAIRLVRSKGAQQVGVIGFSAGASLSCRACTRWNEPAYEANKKDKADTLSCRPDFGILIYPAYLDEGPDHTLTPELTVTKDTPPIFVFGTEDDVKYSGPSTPVIMQAMQQAMAPIEVHYLTRGGHGYGMRQGAGLIWPALAEQWLKGLK